jgi:hypothetical protein
MIYSLVFLRIKIYRCEVLIFILVLVTHVNTTDIQCMQTLSMYSMGQMLTRACEVLVITNSWLNLDPSPSACMVHDHIDAF